MNRKSLMNALVLAAAFCVSTMAPSSAGPKGPTRVKPPQQTRIRVGTYDSRAIAIAWATSKYNPVTEKRRELDAARKAGDANKVKELEAWGPAQQRLLHFQGFGRVPVGDLLLPVKDGVSKVARENRLAAITMQCDLVAPNVEVVDVTDALVGLFHPTDRTRQTIRSMKDVKPLGLLELADMKDTD